MSALPLGAFIQHESSNTNHVAGVDKAVHRDSITPQAPSAFELDQVQWGKPLKGVPLHEESTPPTPGELESSRSASPHAAHAVDAIMQSMTNPPRNKWRLLSANAMFLLMGMNDAAVGGRTPSGWGKG